MTFKNIIFGKAAAESEKSDCPELLINGFLDAYGYTDKILNENKFLVLGSKGSGKSAIGSRLELMSKLNDSLYVQQYYLKDFPYNKFTGILPSKEAPEIKFPNNWELLLLIALLDNFQKDPDCIFSKEGKNNIQILENLELLSRKELSEIVKATTTKKFKIELPKVISYSSSTESKTNIPNMDSLFTHLQSTCYSTRTPNKHLIIIDGLDAVLSQRETQYLSLTALIIAVDRMNQKLRENDSNAKFVILCRTDLLDKLSDPNKNKIVTDYGIYLEWYQDVRDAKSTNIVNLINLRAKVSLKRAVNVYDEYFPENIKGDKPTIKFLLDHTRHTPRDIIQLMNKIQEHTKGENVTQDEIKNGVRMYSIQYFLQEICDELVGFLSDEERVDIFQLFTGMTISKYYIHELKQKQQEDERFHKINLTKILNILYNCNAIGNFNEKNGRFSWKYRNRYSTYDYNQAIVVHPGLHKALNIHDNYLKSGQNINQFINMDYSG